MPIHTRCPFCYIKLRAADTAAGRSKRCPRCGVRSLVPTVNANIPGSDQVRSVSVFRPSFKIQCPNCYSFQKVKAKQPRSRELQTRFKIRCTGCETIVRLILEVPPLPKTKKIRSAPDLHQDAAIPGELT